MQEWSGNADVQRCGWLVVTEEVLQQQSVVSGDRKTGDYLVHIILETHYFLNFKKKTF